MRLNPTSPDATTRPKAVVLLSGGLDSTVALAAVMQTHEVALTLTFNYGQRAWPHECKATQAIARHYGLPHQMVDLPWLADLLPRALTPAERLSPADADSEEFGFFETARVWVPNRNGVLLNIAASFAEKLQAEAVVFGANADEAAGFPDNTQAYRDVLNTAFSYSTLNQVKVLTPVGDLTKGQIIQLGLSLGVPLALIWSCYEDEGAQCGVCPSCTLLKKALAEAGESVGITFSR